MATMRRLGVYGESLPTKKAKTVEASDFGIAGIIGLFERTYDKAFLTQNMNEFMEIFGVNSNSAWYGYDSVNLFYQNLSGVDGKLYVKAHVGNTGSAIDAVSATATINDTHSSPEARFIFTAAYKNQAEYGTHGNRVGYTITNGSRFTTACDGAPGTSDTFIVVDSVAGVRVGDTIKCTHTGPVYVYHTVTSIDESARKLNLDSAFGSASFVDNDVVEVMGLRVRVYEKSLTGIVKEVEEEIGKIYCSLSSSVTDFFIDNVFANHRYMKVVTQAFTSGHTLEKAFPADVTTVTYLASGAYGTAPTTAAHWAFHNTDTNSSFNNLPIRMIANCESVNADVQKAIETYCRARWDLPKVVYNITSNQTKAQLTTIGNSFQRSDDVLGVIVAHWVKITDPFATSSLAPARSVPNVGAVMGAWIRTINTLGIHYIPAVKQVPLFGIVDILGTQFVDDFDRTDLAEAGINCIEYLTGYNYVIRNFFTPSTSTEFKFANGILMREYIKVSAVDSLQSSENMPNSMNRIREDRMALLMFMRRLWDFGSTGTVPQGETFGISENTDGSLTKFEDHIEVRADIVNNPQDRINLGERNIDTYFTYPAPAGSIKIGVGILLRS